jgi:hypothetical protein
MEVLDIFAADIQIVLKLSKTELKHLYTALNGARIQYDGSDQNQKAASKYIAETFFPTIERLLKKVETNVDLPNG